MQVFGLFYSLSLMQGLALWAVSGIAATAIVHFMARRLGDWTFPPEKAYGAALIYGPLSIFAILLLRRGGLPNSPTERT